MNTTSSSAVEPAHIESLLCGEFVRGSGGGATLVDPTSGETIARASAGGLDLGEALAFARATGGPVLRGMSFAERGALLSRIAEVLSANADAWYALARSNSGNTRADAAIDVDGAIATLKFYAKLGAQMGAATLLGDGEPLRLARDPNFTGFHAGTPLTGVAIHINAYNFPSWGMWEKAAVALLAGVPVFTKPATVTAALPAAMLAAVVAAGVLPAGAISMLCGGVGDLLDHLELGDAVAFTGSAEIGERVRSHERVRATGVRVNVEADSLNAALLAPDTQPGSPIFAAFVREVAREMTVKAGQKCTAIRRAFVPAAHVDAVVAALAAALDDVTVGDPAAADVRMGPLVSAAQRDAVAAAIASLGTSVTLAYRAANVPRTGAFCAPTVLRAMNGGGRVHETEIFGPVVTVVPYATPGEAFALVARGGGSLVTSVFSADPAFLIEAGVRLAPLNGRVLLVDPSIVDAHTGHGLVLPSLIHGGPGRAGGGEELGGARGLRFYHQWTALQGAQATIAAIRAQTVDVRSL